MAYLSTGRERAVSFERWMGKGGSGNATFRPLTKYEGFNAATLGCIHYGRNP